MASSERTDTHTPSGPETRPEAMADAGRRGDQGRAAADPASLPRPMTDIQRLRFEATVNGRYHTSRRGWYELMHRWCMFFVVVGGAAAVAEAVGQGHKFSWLIALVPTVAGTIDLVFSFSEKASEHARLQERSYDIVHDIELGAESPEVICKRGWAAIARICSQETKTMRVVQALAYNDTKEGTEKDVQDELLVLPRWARAWKHCSAFNGLHIQSVKEARASAKPA